MSLLQMENVIALAILINCYTPVRTIENRTYTVAGMAVLAIACGIYYKTQSPAMSTDKFTQKNNDISNNHINNEKPTTHVPIAYNPYNAMRVNEIENAVEPTLVYDCFDQEDDSFTLYNFSKNLLHKK